MTRKSESRESSEWFAFAEAAESTWPPAESALARGLVRKRPHLAAEWEGRFQVALDDATGKLFTRLQEAIRVQHLERELVELRNRLALLERACPTVAPIQTLVPEPYEPIRPLHTVISRRDDEYVASLYDANLSASGETELDAFCNLKDIIVATFEVLTCLEAGKLGPGPAHQLLVLRQFIRES